MCGVATAKQLGDSLVPRSPPFSYIGCVVTIIHGSRRAANKNERPRNQANCGSVTENGTSCFLPSQHNLQAAGE